MRWLTVFFCNEKSRKRPKNARQQKTTKTTKNPKNCFLVFLVDGLFVCTPKTPKPPISPKYAGHVMCVMLMYLSTPKKTKKATHFRLQEGFRTTYVCAAISKRKTHSCPFPFPNALIGVQCGQEVDVGRGRRRRNADQMPAKQARSSSSLSGDRIAFIVACINLLKYVAFAGAMRCTWSPA